MRWVSIVALALILAACATVQPLPVKTGDICFGCREPIVEVRLATEMIDAGGRAYKFECPGCMAKYLAGHPEERPKAIFVTDFAGGKMFRAESANFVPIVTDANRGETDYAAFRTAKEAAAFAAEHKAPVPVTWAALMKTAAGG